VSPLTRLLPWSLAVLLVALLAAGVWLWLRTPSAPPPPPPGPPGPSHTETDYPFFRDVTAGSGVDFTYRNGQEADQYAILESLGGGVALLDYDGDGLLDVFVTGGGYFDAPDHKTVKGHPCKLYKNLGGWKFQDVTKAVGLDRIDFYTHGAAVADYNRDGRPDLLVTGWGRVALFRNDPVDPSNPAAGRKFTDFSREAGLLGRVTWGTSAAWGDLDGDGYPDLYVCQYVDWSPDNNPVCEGYGKGIARDVCPPKQFDALPHLLFHNNGDGTFTEIAKEAGLHAPRSEKDYESLGYMSAANLERLRQTDREREYGKGLGVVMVAVTGAGRPDIYVANDTTDKFLYMNRGKRGQVRLEDVAFFTGVAQDDNGLANGSMGVDAGDYDGSGRPSLLVTNYQNELHALYRNLSENGRLRFQYNSRAAGLAGLGRQYVGFGTSFLDLDNHGWEDVVIVNGHVIRYPTGAKVRQRPVLMRNQGRGEGQKDARFVNATASGGEYFQHEHQARGLAVGDLDNDGLPDLVISHVNEPVTILRNESKSGHHWLGVVLADREHRDTVGAKLTLEVGDRKLTRFARGGGSYLSSGDRRHLFGLGPAGTVGRLTVAWPWGETQSWDGLAVDRYWEVSAGEPQARELYGRK
jgi:hypothetical protein